MKRMNAKSKQFKMIGFTLVELLAVIVILSVIAFITTPVILSQIEQSRKAGFINSAKNVLDAADIYASNDNTLSQDGTDIKLLGIKNKESVSGLVFQNKNADYVLKDFTNGSYCASGTRNNLVVRKGDCTNETNLYPDVTVSIKDKTTRTITVEVAANDDTGISHYAYCIEGCEEEQNWTKSEQPQYSFDSLIHSKQYEIHVRAVNKIDKTTEKTIDVTTSNLPTASYNVSPSGWQEKKTVAISYPNNYENYILIHSGFAKLNGTVISVGERVKINGAIATVIFETTGSIEAITSDGYNEASSSTLTISQVDSTPPEQVSVGFGTVTSKSIQVIANGADKESGIVKYEFQVNGGNWIDNGTSNTYFFDNLTSKTYTYKVRLTNKTGLTTTSEEKNQATTSILTPLYSVSPSGWTDSKTVVISYQTGYTNQFKVLSGNATYNGNVVTNNTWVTVTGTGANIVFHSNGTIEARSTDGINTVTASTLTISQIDSSAPVVNSINIQSTNASYNVTTTTINSNVTDNSGATLQMYLSNTGYEMGGTWEDYSSNKTWNVGGTLNGGVRTVYITYKDQAGNKTNWTLSYTVYAECGSNTTTSYGAWGGCNRSCGGGTQARSETTTDNKTAKVCSTGTGTQACNTQSCCSSVSDYQWDSWGGCSKTCGGGVQYRTVHYRSNYDGSYCGNYAQSQACNTQSCTMQFNFDSASDLNYFSVHKWKNSSDYPDATLYTNSGTAYFYTSYLDSFVNLRLNTVYNGISSMEFRLASYLPNTNFIINNFYLEFSDGSTIQFYYNHGNSDSTWRKYLPLPSSYGYRFVVVNNQNGGKYDIGSQVGNGNYTTFYVTVSGSTLTMTDNLGHSYSTNIGARKLVSVTFDPLEMWWGGGASARLDYLRYVPIS